MSILSVPPSMTLFHCACGAWVAIKDNATTFPVPSLSPFTVKALRYKVNAARFKTCHRFARDGVTLTSRVISMMGKQIPYVFAFSPLMLGHTPSCCTIILWNQIVNSKYRTTTYRTSTSSAPGSGGGELVRRHVSKGDRRRHARTKQQ